VDPEILLRRDWFAVLAATVLIGNAVRGLIKGNAVLFYTMPSRESSPLLYWVAVVTSGLLGIAIIIMRYL
jgi:hypothetical protein